MCSEDRNMSQYVRIAVLLIMYCWLIKNTAGGPKYISGGQEYITGGRERITGGLEYILVYPQM